ncbi:50S ribosomal protein L18 [Acidithrix ferrooxidans]|uniref:Large ribosomal subunit protein uL18 n=1 Tax=Acidithrix ferrooxidans TaxID=1280514 RepID=A0A0D8HN79_9ACTN|nr:50S ribosomal protein L18 [Acidithrix ferrooxidans]
MSINKVNSHALRIKRHKRVRRIVVGTTVRPRLAVFRSNKHIVAQIVDDSTGSTIASASTLEADLRGGGATGNIAAAVKVGELVAQRAVQKGIKAVVFDRGGFQYHGRVAALADAARSKGLEF